MPKKPLPNKAILSSPLPRPSFQLRGIGNLPAAQILSVGVGDITPGDTYGT